MPGRILPTDRKKFPVRRIPMIESGTKPINPWKLFNGAFIPNWLLARSELSLGAKVVYARLSQFAGEGGVAYPRIAVLAAAIGMSRGATDKYLRELVNLKLIMREARRSPCGDTECNNYYFLTHKWMGLDEKVRSPLPPPAEAPVPPPKEAPTSAGGVAIEEEIQRRDSIRRDSPLREENAPDSRVKKARSWPVGFTLTAKMSDYASERGVDPDTEFEAFHDWALANGRTYVDWEAAWRTRINNVPRFGGARRINGERMSPGMAQLMEAFKEAKEQEDADEEFGNDEAVDVRSRMLAKPGDR
jgi:hypothetical protein